MPGRMLIIGLILLALGGLTLVVVSMITLWFWSILKRNQDREQVVMDARMRERREREEREHVYGPPGDRL